MACNMICPDQRSSRNLSPMVEIGGRKIGSTPPSLVYASHAARIEIGPARWMSVRLLGLMLFHSRISRCPPKSLTRVSFQMPLIQAQQDHGAARDAALRQP